MKRPLLLLTFCALYSFAASANHEASDSDWKSLYLGASLGDASIANKCDRYALNCDEESLFWGMYGGLRFSEFFSIELAYKETDDFTFDLYYPYRAHLNLLTATAMIHAPISRYLDIFAGAGGAISLIETHDDWGYYRSQDSGVSNGFVAGVQIHPNEQFTLRFMAEQWRNIDGNPAFNGDLDFNLFSINAQFNFR